MPQDTVSIESPKFVKAVSLSGHGGKLKWKINASFSGLILLLGAMIIGIVYLLTANAFQHQVELRSTAIATNLSDAASGYVSKRSILELDAIIAKYGRLDGVAYAYIQDPGGEILASSLKPFPSELNDSTGLESQRLSDMRVRSLRGKSVYETRAPLLDGQLGKAHVGLWVDTAQQHLRSALLPIVILIAVCVIAAIVLSTMIVGRMTQPIIDLKSIADDISRGHLDTTVPVQSNDEVGELARSLERMRASLKAAMQRLNKA